MGLPVLILGASGAGKSASMRNFKPDVEALAEAGVAIEDITPQTIPHDFERNAKIHCCYLVRKA